MTYDMYARVVTIHGVIMIFGFVMPVVFAALGNMFLPLCCAAPEVGYARLNNASIVVY